MKKQILFILTGLVLAVGAGAVIYETTGTDLQVWIQNTIVYSAKVSDIDSISTQETANAKKIRMWVNQAMAYEADVRGIDSITFAESVELIEPDTIPADTIPATELSMQVWINNAIVYTARVSDIDSISAQQTASAKNIRVWVNQAVAYEADVRGIDSITFAKYIEPVIPDTIPTDTIPVIPPDTIPTDTIPVNPDTIPVIPPDTIPTDTIPVIPPDTIPTDTIPADTIPTINCPEGAIPGLFSVAADKRVYFSKGNLQYIDTIWQFAEHQWDYFGTDQSDGHRDLFGWGTGFVPNMVTTTASEYWAFVDWGENAISNGGNKENLWQTLTQPEFTYLFFTRENADSLFGLATVNGIKGLIVLPDNWTLPAGVTFVVSTPQDLVDYGCTYIYNSNSNKFSNNTYTAEQWAVMESAGAVFLPTAGYRSNKTNVLYVGSRGYYWSATPQINSNSSNSNANCMYFSTQYLESANTSYRNYGRSVRLVQPERLPDTVQKKTRHTFIVAESKEVYFSPGNLQYRASTDTWRFAEHQYDTIGTANANISDTYDGWIDLFGWGTGDKPTMSIQDHEYYFYCYHDWGMNPISYPGDTIEHQWRALTSEEWTYLYNKRPNCTHLSGYGKINGVPGYIILPDDWKPREGIEFVGRANSATNTYSLEQWERMEALGAIFLPHAGMRDGTEVNTGKGRYWFSSIEMTFEGCARSLETTNEVGIKNATNTWYGYSVRLIEPVVPEVAPPDPEPIAHPEGAVAGLFSVSETKKVYFSQGNLQYKAGTWRFAEHQYDTIGAENANIAVNYEGWIDLFGWGTGDRPWETSTNTSDYLDSYVDWGVNPISNAGNTPNIWATLTSAEWEYVFNGRPNAIELRGNGIVNGVAGYIFLPDDWQLPYGGRFFPNRGRYLSNVYNLEEWARMEAAGAVFLPNAGKRRGTEVSAGGGHYWSSTKIEAYRTVGYFLVGVDAKAGATVNSATPDYAKSVRMVQPETLPVDTIPADTIPAEEPEVVKSFTVNDEGKQILFAKSNLQYQGNSNTWRFAEHPWDTCGHDNAYMSPVTRKWVDLFGNMRADIPALSSTSDAAYGDIRYSWAKCPIINGEGYQWYPLNYNYFQYIIDKRPNHIKLFSGATVNGVAGLVILPDEWELPNGLTFVSAEAGGMKDKGSSYSGASDMYALNTYSAEEWMRMDSAGAVFFPAAGYRAGYGVSYVQTEGYYWTNANAGQNTTGYSIYFTKSSVALSSLRARRFGCAVRMYRELNDTIKNKPTTPEPKPASVTFTADEDSTQLLFAPGNLQYIDGKYYFAQHQYDTLGNTNRTAGLVTTDGYVGSYAMDLFGWGTGANPMQMTDERDEYSTFTNWGSMPIQNTTDTAWLTPSMPQFRYILRYRNYADKLFGGATVNGIHGLILLPDHFVVPDGIEFHSSTDPDMGFEHYDTHYRSTASASKLYLHNTYNLEQWAKMEAAGAVFLPAAGYRGGRGETTHAYEVNEQGYYWTNSYRSGSPNAAFTLHITRSVVHPESDQVRLYGRSVRLVRKVK